ncbi:MAG: GNAT family N-acetyltransferase [Pseudomonadota bacterium]
MPEGCRIHLTPLSLDVVERTGEAWRDLAAAAADPNPFFDPMMLEPAVRAFGSGGAELLTVRDGRRLIGLAPFQRAVRFGKFPSLHLSTYDFPHLYYGAPLVRAGEEDRFVDALYDWLDSADGVDFLSLPLMRTASPVFRAMRARAEETGRDFETVGGFDRALAWGGGCGALRDAPAGSALGKGSAKKLRAKRRKLAAQGEARYEILRDAEEAQSWLDAFLRMERAGWKGVVGTAFSCDPRDEAFARDLIDNAARAGRLRFARLTVDGRTIASSIDVFAGGCGFALKIAHDPAFDAYSPGVLLEQDNLADIEADPRAVWIDSCAAPDHSVLNRLWTARTHLAHAVVGRDAMLAKLKMRTVFSIRRARRALSGAA